MAGAKVTVLAEQGGLRIVCEDIPSGAAESVAGELTAMMTRLCDRYPELRNIPEHVPGGSLEVTDEEDGGKGQRTRKRRIGYV